jgi:hypothetical protein
MFNYSGHANIVNLERRSVSSPKKKKRKYNIDSSNLTSTHNHPYVQCAAYSSTNKTISIIDRVLDISKYKKEDSLYKLCREWMNASTNINDSSVKTKTPSNRNIDEDNEEDEAAVTSKSSATEFVTKLPDPVKDDESESDKIKKLNQYIQEEIRSTQEADMELIKSLNLDEVIESHALLKLHVNRWKASRKEWINHYKETNKAYKESYDTLKEIFEDI